MKKITLLVLFVFAFTLVAPLYAQDPLEVAGPGIYKKLFENDEVRVLELKLKPSEKIAEHSHPNHFVYVMSDAAISITKDGETKEVQAKSGEVLWMDAETHSSENAGSTEFRSLVVELK